jgi:hypothetical protein
MYPISPTEHLIENRICKHSGVSFPITDKDMEFYEKISPIFGEKKYLIPPPTLSPEYREQRRETWHNEKKVYKNICSKTGREVFSMYHPNTSYTVVSPEYWWSDKWDGLDFGLKWDSQLSAMQQF